MKDFSAELLLIERCVAACRFSRRGHLEVTGGELLSDLYLEMVRVVSRRPELLGNPCHLQAAIRLRLKGLRRDHIEKEKRRGGQSLDEGTHTDQRKREPTDPHDLTDLEEQLQRYSAADRELLLDEPAGLAARRGVHIRTIDRHRAKLIADLRPAFGVTADEIPPPRRRTSPARPE